MMAFLFKLALSIPVLVVLVYVIREIIVYKKMDFFRKQGVKCIYVPLLGILSKYILKKGSKDQIEEMKKLIESNTNEQILVFNTPRALKNVVLILDDELIREFMAKESDVSIKAIILEHLNFGFFFESGDKLTEARAIYSKFFIYQNLVMLSVEIRKAITKKLDQFKSNIAGKKSWTKIDVKVFYYDIMGEIVNTILFGEEKQHFIDGEPLHKACEKYISGTFSIITNPLNSLGLDLPHKFSLLQQTKDTKKLYLKIEEELWELYQSRKKSGPVGVPNLVDLLLEHDKDKISKGQEPLTKREVAGHFILLQFAGADTSHEVTVNSIFRMAKETSIQDEFLQIVRQAEESNGDLNTMAYSHIEQNEKLDDYTQEFLRVGAPFPFLMNRDLIKDTRLGKYSFQKGDRLLFCCSLNHTSSRYFPWKDEFRPQELKRLRATPGYKSAFIPFGQGKRICIGKSLGEMVVKLLLVLTIKSFEVMSDADYEELKMLKITYGYDKPTVLIRERQ